MAPTNLQVILVSISNSLRATLNNKLSSLSIYLISLLFGFFIATAISTMPAQTGDWGIIAAAIIVAFNEIVSKRIYKQMYLYKRRYSQILYTIYKSLNGIKIGIIYGLFVDAFKLGS